MRRSGPTRSSRPASRIGAGAVIGAHCAIGANARIGAGTRLAARVTLYAGVTIGARCLVHSGAVIGADGFGFAPADGAWEKIEQLGGVRIGDDVEIGANTCIDRGALDDTVIEDGVKLDNQIQIGHNVRIGAHTAIAGCVGIAGSADIGAHCTIGGAAMILGHLRIGDRVNISGGERRHALDFAAGPLQRRLSHRRQCRLGEECGHAAPVARLARPAAGPREECRRESAAMTMDIHQILKRLPHRYPFLLVDRVLEIVPGQSLTALKNVTMNEEFFVGHFPHRPVMPGVMILEALAQAAAILAFDKVGAQADDKTVFYFAGIDRARFKRPVEPGRPADAPRHAGPGEVGHRQVHDLRAGRRCARGRGRPDVHDAHAWTDTSGSGMAKVHATALVDASAELADGVSIGPYASSGRKSASARDTTIGPHCVIEGRTTIGRDNRIFQFCSLGAVPQDKKYAGEDTALEIGDRNTIREFCTFNLGTAQDAGVTRIGADNWIMAYVHIAHDCQVGDQTILANNATLGRPRAPRPTGPSSAG